MGVFLKILIEYTLFFSHYLTEETDWVNTANFPWLSSIDDTKPLPIFGISILGKHKVDKMCLPMDNMHWFSFTDSKAVFVATNVPMNI